MVVMRIKWKLLGGHVHCRVFTKPDKDYSTFAKNGDLVFSVAEWPDVMVSFECGGFDVVKEEA